LSCVILGTPDYIAPEQTVDAQDVDIRADIYSLGCTLYFLLTGQTPFPDASLKQKLLWHRQTEPIAVESQQPGLPETLGAVVRRMMAKRPEERYQTPSQVADAVHDFCGEQDVTAALQDMRKTMARHLRNS